MWVGARDWRFGVAVVGAASTWLPWLLYDDRPIFSFYVDRSPCRSWSWPLTLAARPAARARRASPPPRRTVGVVIAGSYVVLVMLNFAWFWPIYTDGLLTHARVARADLVLPLDLTARDEHAVRSRSVSRPQPTGRRRSCPIGTSGT